MIASTLVAIDPGNKGGIAWIDWLGDIHAEPMPAALTPRLDMIRLLIADVRPPLVVVEDVGHHRQGNSARASAALARDVGQLEAAIMTLGTPIYWVQPKTWQKAPPLDQLPRPPKVPQGLEKDERRRLMQGYQRQHKRLIKAMMEHHHPNIRMTLATADAVGILHWALGSPVVRSTIDTKLAMSSLIKNK